MKASATLARFRVLCSLGLGGEAVMPALLSALHGVIPHHASAFFWVDPQGRILNIYDGGVVDRRVLAAYANDFSKHARTAYGCGFATAMRTLSGVQTLPDWGSGFYATGFYNIIWRSFGVHQAIQAIIREGSKPAQGALVLYRSAIDPAFSSEEKRRLADLIPYVAHALSRPRSAADMELEPTDERGLVVLDRKGRIQFCCAAGHRLLALVGYPKIDHAIETRDEAGIAAREILARLTARLLAIFSGRPVAPAVEHIATPWGRIVFRAYWLDAAEDGGNGCIGVTIERHEPRLLQMWRRTAGLQLSPMQEEVCLLLVQGKSRAEIAQRLHIGESTVIDHVRKLYAKLGVGSRDEMFALLERRHEIH